LEASGEQGGGRRCAFCGCTGKLSGEHVWPKWVRDVILSDRRRGGYVYADATPGEPVEITLTRPVAELADLTVKKVCEDCNTGWMHRIEDAVIPILRRPVQGDPTTLRGELRSVATWTFLKCLVVALATSKEHLVPPRTFDWMRRHQRPPQSVNVLMACYGGTRHPLYAGAGTVEFDVQVGDGERTKRHASQVTIGMGHLVCQVFGHHMGGVLDLKLKGWKRDVACVGWPEPTEAVRWPPRVPLDDRTLFEFGRTL
jgi:hypothetical protein